MYSIEAEASFDSAHFLSGYNGKCANLHGHRWRIVATIESSELIKEGQMKGMVLDFTDIKKDLKAIADEFDHCFIYETGTLKESTVAALKEENFRMMTVDFRPTAENFAKYFYDFLKNKGYGITQMKVYETPNNCAIYRE